MNAQKEELIKDIQKQQLELLEHVQQLEMEYNDHPYFLYGFLLIAYLITSYLLLLKVAKIDKVKASWTSYIPVYSLVAYAASVGSYNLWNDRWNGVCMESKLFLVCYCSMQIFDISRSFAEDKRDMTFWAMLLHHSISLLSYGMGIFTHRMHFFGCFAGACEISTVILAISQAVKGPANIYRYYLTCFTSFTYFTCRLILFPIWLIIFFWDLFKFEKWKSHSLLEISIYPCSIMFLLYFSHFFMQKLWAYQCKLTEELFAKKET